MDEEMVRTLRMSYRVFPPWLELVLGILIAIAGISLCLAFWDAGYVHSLALFLPLLGLFAVFNGAVRQRHKVSLESQIRIVRQKGEALVAELARALPSPRVPSQIFRELAIDDRRIQAYLLFLAKESVRAVGPR